MTTMVRLRLGKNHDNGKQTVVKLSLSLSLIAGLLQTHPLPRLQHHYFPLSALTMNICT